MAARTNLAWANLVQSAPRMVASLGGVAFAVVLMFLEMGFLNGLYDSQINVVEKFNADLVIVSTHKQAVCPTQPFTRRRLQQARTHPAVAAAYPVYLEELRGTWKNETNGKNYPVLVFGFHPADPVFTIPAVREQSTLLAMPGTALLDSRSKPYYGSLKPGAEGELFRHKLKLVGTFPLGADFRVDGTMLVGERTFLRSFADPATGATSGDRIEFGLIKVAPGTNVRAVQAALARDLPSDVAVLTLQELCGRVKEYWGNSKPVGYVFGLGMFIGFVIGVMICYQILYTDVVDHLPQFATLKAMGYSNDFLINVVLKQATYLALIGFTPGLVTSWVLYRALESVSGIPMILNGPRISLVFVFTLIMCLVSGSIAIRRAVELDPAEVF
jgi:putative ABC transport system permease protein